MYGWTNGQNFHHFINTLGIITKHQDDFEMRRLLKQPSKYLKHVTEKVLTIQHSEKKMMELITTILKECRMNDQLFQERNLPSSYGSLVAILFKEYLLSAFGENRLRLMEQEKKWKIATGISKTKLNSIIYGGTIKSLNHMYNRGTGILNTITQGARTNNERWEGYKLTFRQNLLYSKILTKKQIENSIKEKESIHGDFVILEKELKNTILTTDLIKILKQTCSSLEYNEILNCEVQTAMYYPKSQYREMDEFLTDLEKTDSKDTYKANKEKNSFEDTRPRIWTSIQLKGLNKLIKTISNTIYGVITSPIFGISNTVISNVTTARARGNIWLTSRALYAAQSITDGNSYSPNTVLELKNGKLPGLSTLSNIAMLIKHRSVKVVSLGGKDWNTLFETKNLELINKEIDELATKHLANFWEKYNLKIQFDIEHKKEHTSINMLYIKKAHYTLNTLENKLIHKYRGIKQLEEQLEERTTITEDEEPMYHKIAKNILKGTNEKITTLNGSNTRTATINDYQKDNKIRPGEIIREYKILNEDLPYKDLREYQRRKLNKNIKDYAPLLIEEIRIEKVLNKRIEDHKR